MTRSCAALALLGAAACCLQAQTPKPAAAPQYPVVTLKFGSPQPTPLGKKGTAMLDNSTCASDGSLFLEIASSPAKMDFSVHSLTDGIEDVRFAASVVPGYKGITWPAHYFVNDNAVVTMVYATPVRNPMAEGHGATPQVLLALIYDRNGTLEHVVPIPPKINAKSIGMYKSGDLLVVSKDAAANRLHLMVLDHDGDIKNELSLFDYDYDANRKARKKQPLAKVMDAADFIQIVPHGDDLLLVPKGTAATVVEVNEHGIVRATDLKLPPGYLIRSFLSVNGAYWTISTYEHAKIIYNKGRGSANFHNGPLFQFNSFDGSLVRRIDMPEKSTADIICAHNDEFTAFTTDKDTGRLELLSGSIPR